MNTCTHENAIVTECTTCENEFCHKCRLEEFEWQDSTLNYIKSILFEKCPHCANWTATDI